MPTQLTVASAADMVKVFEQGNLPTPLLLQDLCLFFGSWRNFAFVYTAMFTSSQYSPQSAELSPVHDTVQHQPGHSDNQGPEDILNLLLHH
jgi:hypothetical protein